MSKYTSGYKQKPSEAVAAMQKQKAMRLAGQGFSQTQSEINDQNWTPREVTPKFDANKYRRMLTTKKG